MQKGQAERLFPLMEDVLSECDKGWSDLDAIGVCVGPGNFTGVRISVASARGLAMSLGIPAVGVSKLEAMAYGTSGYVTSILDARRDRVYIQSFEDTTSTSEPQMTTLEDICNHVRSDDILRMVANETVNLGGQYIIQQVEDIVVSVGHIAGTRYLQDQPRPAPLYLRSADAALPSDPPVVILS
jgi:tRNA threonylcarbamoyl adenosine modification protein YeaZ